MHSWSFMNGLARSVLVAFCLAATASADVTISGRVTFDEKPVANAAVRLTYPCEMSDTVFYPTSRWRRSSAVVRTDGDGRFSVQESKAPLCVRCEVAAPGLWNPAASTTLTKFADIPIKLERISTSRPEHASDVRAKLLDAAGLPMAGAVLRVRAVRFAATKTASATSSTRAVFGAPEGSPGLLMTNEAGEFDCFAAALLPERPVGSGLVATSMTFTVDGGPYDGRPFSLTPSPNRADCRLVASAAITGIVERAGSAAADLPVSLMPSDVDWLMDDVPWTVRTDTAGKFTIENVWPGVPLSLYVPVSQPGGAGGSSRRSLEPLAPADRRQADTIQVLSPRTIKGAISTEDNIKLPEGSGLAVTIVETKEVFVVPVSDTGAFTITGLPDGAQVRLIWAVTNTLRNAYIISPRSPSRSRYIGALEGIVDRDIDNLQMRYDKVRSEGPFGASPYDRPFRSIKDPIPGEG